MNVQLVSSFHEKLNLKQKPELNPEIDVLGDMSMAEFGNQHFNWTKLLTYNLNIIDHLY